MTGSSNGPTYINATYSYQKATSFPSRLRVPEIIPFNQPVSPADLYVAEEHPMEDA